MLERLQKIISRAGIASRRHAEELIRGGQVRVNGVVVSELGSKADPEHDRVEAAGQLAVLPQQAGYYMLNKPAHVVSTMSDPEGRATLRHLLKGLPGIFPVGRLDYAASGLVLLTSDGVLADRILKNSASIPKVYWMKVKGKLSDETQRQVRVEARARLRLLRAPGAAGPDAANPWYEVEIGDARRDLLRGALFALDHPVEKIRRVKFGPLDLGALDEARYRALEPAEIEQLKQAVARAEKAPHAPAVKRKKHFRPRPAFAPPGRKLTPPGPLAPVLPPTAFMPPTFASRVPGTPGPLRASPRATPSGRPATGPPTRSPNGSSSRSRRSAPPVSTPRPDRPDRRESGWRKHGPPRGGPGTTRARVPPQRGRPPSDGRRSGDARSGHRPAGRPPSAPSARPPSGRPPFGHGPSGHAPGHRPPEYKPSGPRPPGRGPRRGPR